MSADLKALYAMRCDHADGCSRELETYDGGAWLYDTPEEARAAAYDSDWTRGEDGKDYCDLHRDDAEPAADVEIRGTER